MTGAKNFRRRDRQFRLRLEKLESRDLLATFTVSNGADSGTGSLREAIGFANAAPGTDTIDFVGVSEVRLTTTQLTITDSLTIDGSSVPGGVTVTAADADSDPGSAGSGIRVFRINSIPAADPVVFRHLNVTGGDVFGGGGGIQSNHGLVLEHVTVSNNSASDDGGGLEITDHDLSIRASTVTENVSLHFGGGIFFKTNEYRNLQIEDSIISGNTATSIGGGMTAYSLNYGGGINVRISSSLVEGNQARFGSGLDILLSNFDRAAGLIEDTVIRDNFTVDRPGYTSASAAMLIGVYGDAVFEIRDSVIEQNSATYSAGASLGASEGALIRVADTIVRGNSASAAGGGLTLGANYYGEILVERTTVTGNSAAGRAGGIDIRNYGYSYSSITIQDSLIADNQAGSNGAGVFIQTSVYSYMLPPSLTISNSTISGNSAGSRGGGVSSNNYGTKLYLDNSTIANNYARLQGGGVFADTFSDVSVRSTILADNVRLPGLSDDLVGSVAAESSLIEAPFAGTHVYGNNIVGVDPRLGPLQDNGGDTLTHALTFGSRAVDAGALFGHAPAFDQRGKPFDRVVGNGVDIGAFELQSIAAGDFNGDGHFDCDDINELGLAIANASTDPIFDLNDDGALDLDDLAEWLSGAGRENLSSQNPYLLGDANLDGFVDGLDFIIWNQNRFTDFGVWCTGDFNADVVVDGLDFLIWNQNKFQNSFDQVSLRPFTDQHAVRKRSARFGFSEAPTTPAAEYVDVALATTVLAIERAEAAPTARHRAKRATDGTHLADGETQMQHALVPEFFGQPLGPGELGSPAILT